MKKTVLQSIRRRYVGMPIPLKAGLCYTICSVLQKGISMVTVPIFTRIMTTKQFGVFTVYQSWYSIVSIFATLNLFYGVFNNGMIKFESDRNRFISSIQGLTTALTTIVLIVYLINPSFWNGIFKLSSLFVAIMFIELYFAPAYSFWSAKQRFNYRYKELVILTLFQSILTPIVGIIAVLSTEYKAEARVISYVLIEACIGLVLYIYNSYKGKSFYVKEYWRFALGFNIPLIPHYLSQVVLQQSDRIMISSMIGIDKAAIYGVTYNISSILTLITNSINNAYIPYTYKCLKNKDYTSIKKNTTILVGMIAAMSAIIMLFGPEIVRVFAPPEYYESIYIIPPVAASVFFMFLYPVFGNVEFYYEENKFIMIASVIGAVANIVLNYLFIPTFGYVAAGYTTLACYMMFGGGHYYFMKKVLKRHEVNDTLYDYRSILTLSTAELIIATAVSFLYRHTLIRYSVVLACVVIAYIKRKNIISIINDMSKIRNNPNV